MGDNEELWKLIIHEFIEFKPKKKIFPIECVYNYTYIYTTIKQILSIP